MWIKTSSDELNAMNESIVKHICWHLILLNRNTRFLFESFDPYQSNVFCHSGFQHHDWIIVFYFRGQFIVQISISRQSHSNGFLTSWGINDDSFLKLWTITPSSTDANENDSLLLSEWIALMFLMHVDGRWCHNWGRLSRTCCFSLIWRGEQETVRWRGGRAVCPPRPWISSCHRTTPRPGLFGGLALIQQRQRLTSAAAALRAPRRPKAMRGIHLSWEGEGWLGRWGCLKVS